jgi:hypothetical protein
VMDGANLAHQKMLYRAIKFVDHTKNRELVLKPTNEYHWNIKGYSDSDYAGDADNRRSVSGYVIYFNNCPIAWKSRGQKTVALSSTEAEYIALSEVSTEIVFISEVLKFMDVPISYPIEINVDNVGAIYLAKNASTTTRTKHIDIRYYFIREHIDNGNINIMFVRSEDNTADIMTKNLSGELFHKHNSNIFMKTEENNPNERDE